MLNSWYFTSFDNKNPILSYKPDNYHFSSVNNHHEKHADYDFRDRVHIGNIVANSRDHLPEHRGLKSVSSSLLNDDLIANKPADILFDRPPLLTQVADQVIDTDTHYYSGYYNVFTDGLKKQLPSGPSEEQVRMGRLNKYNQQVSSAMQLQGESRNAALNIINNELLASDPILYNSIKQREEAALFQQQNIEMQQAINAVEMQTKSAKVIAQAPFKRSLIEASNMLIGKERDLLDPNWRVRSIGIDPDDLTADEFASENKALLDKVVKSLEFNLPDVEVKRRRDIIDNELKDIEIEDENRNNIALLFEAAVDARDETRAKVLRSEMLYQIVNGNPSLRKVAREEPKAVVQAVENVAEKNLDSMLDIFLNINKEVINNLGAEDADAKEEEVVDELINTAAAYVESFLDVKARKINPSIVDDIAVNLYRALKHKLIDVDSEDEILAFVQKAYDDKTSSLSKKIIIDTDKEDKEAEVERVKIDDEEEKEVVEKKDKKPIFTDKELESIKKNELKKMSEADKAATEFLKKQVQDFDWEDQEPLDLSLQFYYILKEAKRGDRYALIKNMVDLLRNNSIPNSIRQEHLYDALLPVIATAVNKDWLAKSRGVSRIPSGLKHQLELEIDLQAVNEKGLTLFEEENSLD